MRKSASAAFAASALVLAFAAPPALAQSDDGGMPMRTPTGTPTSPARSRSAP